MHTPHKMASDPLPSQRVRDAPKRPFFEHSEDHPTWVGSDPLAIYSPPAPLAVTAAWQST